MKAGSTGFSNAAWVRISVSRAPVGIRCRRIEIWQRISSKNLSGSGGANQNSRSPWAKRQLRAVAPDSRVSKHWHRRGAGRSSLRPGRGFEFSLWRPSPYSGGTYVWSPLLPIDRIVVSGEEQTPAVLTLCKKRLVISDDRSNYRIAYNRFLTRCEMLVNY